MKGELIDDRAHYRSELDTWCELFVPVRVVSGRNWPVCDRVAP